MPKKLASITIDYDVDKQVRNLQAKMLSTTNKNWSYSAVLNLVMREGLISFNFDEQERNHK
jgi:hypothetical protein